jgi:hypothetical protein
MKVHFFISDFDADKAGYNYLRVVDVCIESTHHIQVLSDESSCCDTSDPFVIADHNLFTSRKVYEDVNLDLLKSWIQHSAPEQAALESISTPFETRFVDIDAIMIVRGNTACDYVALSYVWGGIAQPSLDRET